MNKTLKRTLSQTTENSIKHATAISIPINPADINLSWIYLHKKNKHIYTQRSNAKNNKPKLCLR